MSAMTQAIRRAMVDGQDLGLKGAPLRRYIERNSSASGDLIGTVLGEMFSDPTVRITGNMEFVLNDAAQLLLQQSGFATGHSVPINVIDGTIVIGGRDD